MSDKTLKTRIQHKRGTANDWSQATNFIPLDGELIIYNEKNGTSPKFKVGDGTTLVGNLPFVTSEQSGGGTVSGDYLPIAGGTLTGQLSIKPSDSAIPLRLETSTIDASSFASNVGQYAVQIMDANASTVGYSQMARNTAGYIEYRHGAYLGSAYNDSGANKTTYLYARVKKDGSTETGTNSIFYGAVWNDYAEFRTTVLNVKPGQVVVENGDGSLSISTKRLQAGCEVVSDTYGFAIGKTEKAETPIAVSGRVLAYTYEDRNTFVPGEPVCSGPNGTVSRMTREEAKEYPERIIGTVSEIPEYKTWGAEKTVVDNRIWIRIK